ncbi:thioesterase II family protein [Mycobacterium sp. TY813]|uniref:thioesterase II family protein n=1 Tax=Mycobacterium TaxID=1763 RepID=UPI0027429957|nr:thioesterase domain-containing protein [Mycobacterium sp. TY813]MDP7733001.1 thioesterase domain-containing protein [Mycobacterium sp. TY813]
MADEAIEDLLLHLPAVAQSATGVAASDAQAAPWLRSLAPSVASSTRLFCFPGIGRGSSIYEHSPPSLMGEHAEVCTIELPGRGLRAHVVPLGRVDEIVSQVAPALRYRLDLPFAFFGIDVGAILMFETTRRLRAEDAPVPDHFFVAAAMAPQTCYLAPMHYPPRQQLLRALHNLDFVVDESLVGERALRADVAAVSSYVFVQDPEVGDGNI